MGLKRITFLLTAALLVFSACSRSAATPSGEAPANSNENSEPTLTPSPPPTATLPPTSTPEPTPIVPAVEVSDQTLTEDGLLIIDNAITPDAGWLAIYQLVDEEPGDLLGYERLVPGENSEVTIRIEPREATPTLIAQLHEDAGEQGVFEFPGDDAPLSNGAELAAETFSIDIDLPIPTIDVADQAISYDGLLTVNNVFALVPGWLVIHNNENGTAGAALGQFPVQPGQSNDFSFPIRWRDAETTLMAVLYEDSEQPGGFDERVDLPVLDDGQAVTAEFSVSLPPDLLIYDQPVRDGKLIVERVTSDKPAWVVAYQDQEDLPGLIIGSAFVEAGVSRLVDLEVEGTAVSQRLFLMLHEDTGTAGRFDFPAADLPVVNDGQPLPPFIMHTTPGNYLITEDQPLGEDDTVRVPLVVTDLYNWVVIYNVNDVGEADEIIGQTALPPGINRDVPVKVDPELVTREVIARLHQDNAPLETFDYPGGVDNPLLRNFLPIQSPIDIQPTAEADRPLP